MFTPYSNIDLDLILDTELATSKLSNLSKSEIVSIIDSARKVSLWDRFFKSNENLKNFPDEIEELRKYRNIVMHNKSLSKQDYDIARKKLNNINNRLDIAIDILSERIYTKNDTLSSAVSLAFLTIFDSIGVGLRTMVLNAVKNIDSESIAKMLQKMTDSLIGIQPPKLEMNFSMSNAEIEDENLDEI